MNDDHAIPTGEPKLRYSPDYPPPDLPDAVIDVYKKDIDRTLLRENLKLTVEQRLEKLASFMEMVEGLRKARRAPADAPGHGG